MLNVSNSTRHFLPCYNHLSGRGSRNPGSIPHILTTPFTTQRPQWSPPCLAASAFTTMLKMTTSLFDIVIVNRWNLSVQLWQFGWLIFVAHFLFPLFTLLLIKENKKQASLNCLVQKGSGMRHHGFPRHHWPQYWRSSVVFDFSKRTGWGIFTTIWPHPTLRIQAVCPSQSRSGRNESPALDISIFLWANTFLFHVAFSIGENSPVESLRGNFLIPVMEKVNVLGEKKDQ